MITLTVGVLAVVSKYAVLAFGTFAEIKMLADFFATGCVGCSISSWGIRLDWCTQTCCDWHFFTKWQAVASPTGQIISHVNMQSQSVAREVGLSQGPHISVFLWGVPAHCAVTSSRRSYLRTDAAGYCAKSRDTTVWYLTSSRAIAESEAILQVAYLFHASSQELRSVIRLFSVLRFLADFWLHVNRGGVCRGSKSLSKLTYLPRVIRSCRYFDNGGVHVIEMEAVSAAPEL